MVGGESGRHGLNVRRPVVEERLRGQENVTVLHQRMGANTVRVKLIRPEIVERKTVSCFEKESRNAQNYGGFYIIIIILLYFIGPSICRCGIEGRKRNRIVGGEAVGVGIAMTMKMTFC